MRVDDVAGNFCLSVYMGAVDRADLEASPGWLLQQRLTSLEARAAALLLEEEEVGPGRYCSPRHPTYTKH